MEIGKKIRNLRLEKEVKQEELAEYLGQALQAQLEQSLQSGRQYRDDAAYVEGAMASFNGQADRLREAMEDVVLDFLK